ncbi:MAG: formate/nitrite transporter family protein, partial [Gemmatimonadales bacterium]
RVLRRWGIVLPAYLVGAALFALVVARTRSLEMPNAGALLDVARGATSDGFGLTFLRAIWAGWLVALMAWLLASTRETIAQIALIVATTAPIAAFGFRHSIAGAVEAFYRVWMSDANLGALLWSFELPALLGNIIGGVVLVALVNHGQAGSRPAGV